MSDEHAVGALHGNIRTYVFGFVFSLVLTAIPFLLVMTSLLPRSVIVIAVVLFAVSQVAVHLVFFLDLGRPSQNRWPVIIFAYTLLILGILVGLSIWIMNHLDTYHMVM